MAPQTAKSLMKDFRASFRRKKVTDLTPKLEKAKEQEIEEQAKLKELKENLGENFSFTVTDADLVGFLRARSLCVKEAEKLVKVDGNLRKFLMMDDFVENHELSEVNSNYNLSGVIGFDKEGSLVRVINMGRGDSKGVVHSVSTIDHFKLFLMFIEKDRRLQAKENKKTGRNQSQFVYIIDLEDITMSKVMYKPSLDTGLLALKLLQEHYHDLPKAIYVVNAPPYYSTIYKLIKPVIQDSLQKKMRIFGSGENWKDELLKHIDSKVLPEYLGGVRRDENDDPFCKSFIGFGGTIPEKFYSTAFLDPDDPEVTSMTVPAGSHVNYRVPMPIVGTTVRWHIQAKENDIGIGVFMEPLDAQGDNTKSKKKSEDISHLEPITPIIRSQCHICPEQGESVSWLPVTTVLHFDNSYSWMNSKEVMFKLEVIPPTET